MAYFLSQRLKTRLLLLQCFKRNSLVAVIMPLIAFGLAKLFNMNNIRTLMLMVMGSCPGGSTSNVAVIWLDGDVDLRLVYNFVRFLL